MKGSNGAIKTIRAVLTLVVVAAFCGLIFTGDRYNDLLLSTPRVTVSLCHSKGANYEMVEMKAPACVSRGAAAAWNRNELYLMLSAVALVGSLVVSQLIERKWRQQAEREPSHVMRFVPVMCVILYFIWGLVPALVCGAAALLWEIGTRLNRQP